MANYIENVDDYGINLMELKERAVAEGKNEYAIIFDEAINEAKNGNTEWYTRICRDIAFMVANTGMDALRIELSHIQKNDACANGTCLDK